MRYATLILLLTLSAACRARPAQPEEVPQPGPSSELQFEVLALSYADADQTAAALNDLLDDATQGGEPPVPVLVDPRTNSLLVCAEPGHMRRLKELVAQLDRPSGDG